MWLKHWPNWFKVLSSGVDFAIWAKYDTWPKKRMRAPPCVYNAVDFPYLRPGAQLGKMKIKLNSRLTDIPCIFLAMGIPCDLARFDALDTESRNQWSYILLQENDRCQTQPSSSIVIPHPNIALSQHAFMYKLSATFVLSIFRWVMFSYFLNCI